MAELAIRTLPKALTCKKNPFAVKKSALRGPVSPRYDELARPTHPRDPIERPPPREKDSFGRPIYAKPVKIIIKNNIYTEKNQCQCAKKRCEPNCDQNGNRVP